MTRMRAIVLATALAAVALIAPAAAQAAPPSSSSVVSVQENWKWND
jgi:hypothetical protein